MGKGRKTGRYYPHVQPSKKACQKIIRKYLSDCDNRLTGLFHYLSAGSGRIVTNGGDALVGKPYRKRSCMVKWRW
jgi:hypothetical protein